jgi:hypothetical protein
MGAERLPFVLTRDEMEALTGSPQPSRQRAWLTDHGFPFEDGLDGRPRVLRAAVEARMMPSSARRRAKTEPNLAMLPKAS